MISDVGTLFFRLLIDNTGLFRFVALFKGVKDTSYVPALTSALFIRYIRMCR